MIPISPDTPSSKHNSSQIESWLLEDGVSGDLELLYRSSRDGWKALDFHDKCDNKGTTITVIRSSDGLYLVDLLINHGNP